jgi:hypothetical protein
MMQHPGKVQGREGTAGQCLQEAEQAVEGRVFARAPDQSLDRVQEQAVIDFRCC